MIPMLRVKGWADFQHYKGRRPPWIKLHRQLLDDYDFHRLPLASKALAPLIWLLASEHDGGAIPWVPEQVAFRVRLTEGELQQAVTPLISGGFFVMDTGRKQDASTPLAPCKQDAIAEESREEESREEAEAESRTLRRQIDRCRAEVPETYRAAVEGALRSHHNPEALAAELCMLADGGRGIAYSWEVIGRAIHEMAVAGTAVTSNILVAFCRRAAEAPKAAAGANEVERMKAAVEELDRKKQERMRRQA